MQSQQANLAYGFGWVFFDAFLSFAGLLILRIAIKGFNRPGVPIIMFLISGLIPWLMFGACYRLPEGAIKKGKNLLLLPIITELDLVLASAARIFLTFAILFVSLATIDSFYENVPFPRFPLGISLLFICMSIMGVSFGFFLMVLNRLYSPAGKFVGFFLRFSTIFSGVIFQVTMFPPSIWPYITWNPMLHIEELLRTYWFYSYQTPIGSPLYVSECLIGMAFFGLLLERYARQRLPA
jgi:capsular polysaccharide transport system permease protein